MATMTARYTQPCTSRPSNFNFIGLLLIVLLAAAVVGGIYVTSHGLKHAGALDVRKCIDNGGTFEFWHNPSTNREAWLCMVGPKYGIAIRANGKVPITEFIKEKMNSLTQVRNYLRNTGYRPGHLPGYTP